EDRGIKVVTADFMGTVLANIFGTTTTKVHTLRKHAANFFKHADNDPDGEFEFNPDAWNTPVLAWCLACLLHMRESLTLAERAFWLRVAVEHPDLNFAPPGEAKDNPRLLKYLQSLTRREFWMNYKRAEFISLHRAPLSTDP